MKTDHAWLHHALAIVTRERDFAVKEKHQLQAKLENLEQVLKVGGDASASLRGSTRDKAVERRVAETPSEAVIQSQALGAVFALFMLSKAINNKIPMFPEAVP